jgi:hypothetical protein
MDEITADAIRETLGALQKRFPKRSQRVGNLDVVAVKGGYPFGADWHGFLFDPPMTPGAVEAFERTHEVTLPAEYRWFLLNIASAGAGPFYGLVPLGRREGENDSALDWGRRQLFAWDFDFGRPSRPFKYRAAHRADDDDVVDGALPLAHEGCNLMAWLVVTGPLAGQVWHTEPGIGWWPWLDPKGRTFTFLGWYIAWLTLAKRARNLQAPLKPWISRCP